MARHPAEGAADEADEGEAPGDHDLIRRLEMRDERALETLYDRYSGLVFTLALRIVGDRHLAEEVLQDTFWRCWEGAGRYESARGRVAGWLMGIARNRAIDLLRSRQHRARQHEREPLPGSEAGSDTGAPAGSGGAEGGTDVFEVVLLRQTIGEALHRLPEAQRQAIELAYYGGLTQTEIAQRVDVPLGTVKSRLRDGMGRLRHWLLPGGDSARTDQDREVKGTHGTRG